MIDNRPKLKDVKQDLLDMRKSMENYIDNITQKEYFGAYLESLCCLEQYDKLKKVINNNSLSQTNRVKITTFMIGFINSQLYEF